MSFAVILRVLIFVAIAVAIWLGLRRIWRDWRGHYKAIDKSRHAADLRERERPDVITLKRDKDGTFRPGEDDKDRR